MATSRSSAAGRYICSACRHQTQISARRTFASASPLRQDALTNLGFDAPTKSGQQPLSGQPSEVMDTLRNKKLQASYKKIASDETAEDTDTIEARHRLHVLASKHNTHITLTQPLKSAMLTVGSSVSRTTASAADRKKMVDTLISVSTGNIGFRKAGRGEYDAAFQLGAFVMKQIKEKGMLQSIQKLEVVLRGFGAGRQAVEKILLGTEGRHLRPRIVTVVDATRLKFGGTRSPRPRRLG